MREVMAGGSAILGWLLLLLLAPAASLEAQVRDNGDGQELVEIRFEGATSFGEGQLRAAIVSRETRCRNPAFFIGCWFGFGMDPFYLDNGLLSADALRLWRFYLQRGYREARVDVETEPADDGYRAVFRVHEGQPVRVARIEVEGTAGVVEPEIAERLPLRLGQPLSEIALDASRDSLVQAFRNRGYPHAEVLVNWFVPTDTPFEADVRFEVVPGTLAYFGEIEIEGNVNVDTTIVRRMLSFRSGDVFSQEDLIRSQSNLFSLEVFNHASIQPILGAGGDSVVPVRVRVNEGNIHRVRLGAGLNEADCVNAEGRWTSRNFLGGARRLEVRGGISNVLASSFGDGFPCSATGSGIYSELSGSFAVDFTQPWFFSPSNTLGAGLLVERRSYPEVFVRNVRGGYLSLTRSFGARTSLSFGFRPELARLNAEDDLFFCTNFIACAESQIQQLKDPHWLAPVSVAYAADRTNAIFTPSRGYVLWMEAEWASEMTGSDFAYTRVIGDFSHFRQIARGVVLATHLRPGWARVLDVSGDAAAVGLNPQKRFFAGGPNSVRGFAQYRLGPKVLMVDAADLMEPLDDGWPGCTAAAVDAGSCDAQPLASARPSAFTPRPVGGEVLLEGSAELRFPIAAEKWRGAAFVDFGQVWRSEHEVRLRDLVFTPGLGIRYSSPVGPIRVDVGYNTQTAEHVPVITTRSDDPGRLQPLVDAAGDPQSVAWRPRRGFFDRLQFHFSIGQAF